MNREYQPFEKIVLKLNIDDTSYIFTKPDSQEYKSHVLVIRQDAYGQVKAELHNEEDMKRYLTYDQYKEVMGFIHKPQPMFKF